MMTSKEPHETQSSAPKTGEGGLLDEGGLTVKRQPPLDEDENCLDVSVDRLEETRRTSEKLDAAAGDVHGQCVQGLAIPKGGSGEDNGVGRGFRLSPTGDDLAFAALWRERGDVGL